MTTAPARLLSDADRWSVQRLLDRDPYIAAQVSEQVQAFGLAWWRSQARVFGYHRGRVLESVCWVGHNLIPVRATPAAARAFAELVALNPRSCSAIVGDAAAVHDLWSVLGRTWGPAREVRACQPLLATGRESPVAPDPEVRLVGDRELDAFMPASVAMYTEEVGISPARDGTMRGYRQRVRDLVRARRAYARFVDGRVVFKAELAVVTRQTAQVQGVWVAPEWRGRGLGTHCVAAVVRDTLSRVAPTVSLYVNDFNHAARRVYARCGFAQVGTLASVLF